jgi:hypothetical protein
LHDRPGLAPLAEYSLRRSGNDVETRNVESNRIENTIAKLARETRVKANTIAA